MKGSLSLQTSDRFNNLQLGLHQTTLRGDILNAVNSVNSICMCQYGDALKPEIASVEQAFVSCTVTCRPLDPFPQGVV